MTSFVSLSTITLLSAPPPPPDHPWQLCMVLPLPFTEGGGGSGAGFWLAGSVLGGPYLAQWTVTGHNLWGHDSTTLDNIIATIILN